MTIILWMKIKIITIFASYSPSHYFSFSVLHKELRVDSFEAGALQQLHVEFRRLLFGGVAIAGRIDYEITYLHAEAKNT